MREHLERLLLELAIAFRIGYYLATIIERGYVILTLRPDKLAAATIPVSTGWLLGDCMEASMSPTRSNSGWTTRSADAKGRERPRDVRPPKRYEAEERQRREQLKTAVDHWHYAERIHRYLTAIEAGVADRKLRAKDEQAFAKWFEWAYWYADHVDPLIHAEPLPEKISPPINTPLPEVELTSRLRPIIDGLGIQDTNGLYGLGRDAIQAIAGDFSHAAWDEMCVVLEGLGYDVSDRRYYH